jgi:hypothetical protein
LVVGSSFQILQKSIIESTAIAISLDGSFIMLSRDADSHAVIFSISHREAVQSPVRSKKGSSFFEDPAYFVFSESVFLGNHLYYFAFFFATTFLAFLLGIIWNFGLPFGDLRRIG